MALRVILCGATGWVGKALAPAILSSSDLQLVAGVSRSGAGQDLAAVIGGAGKGVPVFGTLREALARGADVVIDYTKPHVVKGHALEAIAAGVHVVIGTSGLGAPDYDEIDAAARAKQVGVFAAGNFSITAALLARFTLEAARFVPDVEITDYASASKPDTPSGTGRELAERLGKVRLEATAKPVSELGGIRETRGADIAGVRVHSVRMPGYVLSVEAMFGLPGERLTIRHDAGESAAPYVGGTLLAARRVAEIAGLRRGMDALLFG